MYQSKMFATLFVCFQCLILLLPQLPEAGFKAAPVAHDLFLGHGSNLFSETQKPSEKLRICTLLRMVLFVTVLMVVPPRKEKAGAFWFG